MPHAGDHLSSLIQIPKLSERPWIVPHEVLDIRDLGDVLKLFK
jgi:hypothetical protein